MPFSTYSELKTSVLGWLERTGDTTAEAVVSDWVTLAENGLRIQLLKLRLQYGEINNTAFAINSEYVDLPNDFIGARALRLNSEPKNALRYIAPQTADGWYELNRSPNIPQFYTIQGNKIRVSPAPSGVYEATFAYYALPSLSNSSPTNWLLTTNPLIYLYATLAIAYGFYEDIARRDAQEAKVYAMLTELSSAVSGGANAGSLTVIPSGSTP